MKDIFSPFYCIYLCRSLRKMLHICTLELPEFLSEGRARGVEGREESRLLHMSVAMGILAQWLCSNVAAGMEDLFSQGRLWKKNGVCMSWSLSRQLCGGGIYFRKRVSRALLRPGARCCLRDLWSFHTTSPTVQIKLSIVHHTNGQDKNPFQ